MIPSARALSRSTRSGNIVYCDGGLCNRLNALIYALALRNRFGHEWSLSWPSNNWCGAKFGALFSIDMPVLTDSLQHYTHLQDEYLFLVHEVQTGLRADRVVRNQSLTTMDAYGAYLNAGKPVFYYHNLFPHPLDTASIRAALRHLRVNPVILDRARVFCLTNAIDRRVKGLHIRKTDFGRAVDDSRLFDAVAVASDRFFVCSDDREVNERFGALANCCVLEKSHFPEKLLAGSDWNASITDSDGRRFPYNITRSEASVVEGLVDLLILSATTVLATSPSTFVNMARLFHDTEYLGAA
jgi:hypothetical protein